MMELDLLRTHNPISFKSSAVVDFFESTKYEMHMLDKGIVVIKDRVTKCFRCAAPGNVNWFLPEEEELNKLIAQVEAFKELKAKKAQVATAKPTK